MRATGSSPRLAVPDVETPEHVVEQLAAAARDSRPSPSSPGRLMMAVAVACAVLLVSVGGAWASGVVDLPGLPDLGVDAPTEQTPGEDPPAPVTVPPASTPSDPDAGRGSEDGQGASTSHRGKSGDAPGEQRGRGKRADDGQRTSDTKGTSEGRGSEDRGAQGAGGRPEGPGRSDEAPRGPDKRQNEKHDNPGKPVKPEKLEKPDKPIKLKDEPDRATKGAPGAAAGDLPGRRGAPGSKEPRGRG